MSEIDALQKRPCPGCGAEAVWNPSHQALVCPNCGTKVEGAPTFAAGDIQEHDLEAALQSLDTQSRGWAASKRSVRCQHCSAVSVFDPERVAQRCDFCGSAQLIPYEESEQPFTPESVLPLQITEPMMREKLRAWLKGVWFAPNNLSSKSLTDQTHGIYLPYWTFDADVNADWTAEAGHYYYTTTSYRDSQGVMREKRERHTRWEPAAGNVQHKFDDMLIPASRGVQAKLLRAIEPFPTQDLVPYAPDFVSGWTVEQYQVDLREAAGGGRERMEEALREMIVGRIPGDTYRNLNVASAYSAQTFKHILAPVWLATYVYRSKSYQVAVNGVTGSISGGYPKSWIKITLAVIGVLMLVLIVAAVLQNK